MYIYKAVAHLYQSTYIIGQAIGKESI